MVALVIVLIVALVVVVGIAGWLYYQKQRTEHLRRDFGPEYDRTVAVSGDRRRAETQLAARKERVEQLQIRPLAAADQSRFVEAWRGTQAHFVDAPAEAIGEADRLIGEVMAARGYPVGDFEQRAADISVDHPSVVSHYRAAHRVALANTNGNASTEELRQAMIHYRALFDELLGAPAGAAGTATEVGNDGRVAGEGQEARR